MANVPTNEAEQEYSEPVSMVSIREALQAIVPQDTDIVSDIRLHDGIADIMIRWKTLRWSTNMAYQNLTPKEIAALADSQFRKWLVGIVTNMNDTPKFGRVVQEMRAWMAKNPDKAAWLKQDAAPLNKTTMAA